MVHVFICYISHSSLQAVLFWRVAPSYTANQRATSHFSSHMSENCLRGTSEINDIFCPYPRAKFLTIKPTRFTDFSNLLLEWNSLCFGQHLCPSSGVFHCKHSNGICHTVLLTAVEQDQDVPYMTYTFLCVQWKTPDDEHRNCPKYVQFHSKNKFEKLVHLVCFIIRNLSRCTVTWTPRAKILLSAVHNANFNNILMSSQKRNVCGMNFTASTWCAIIKWLLN
jgi:hypothetical protein